MKLQTNSKQSGIALVTAIMLLFILGVLGSTFMMLTTTDVRIASNQAIASRLLYIAEAGISEALARLASGDGELMDTTVFQNSEWRAEIHLTRDDDSTNVSGDTIVFRSPTRQSGDTLPYVSDIHHVTAKYLKDATDDSISYYNVKNQSIENLPKDSIPSDPFLFPIVQIESTARKGGMKRKIVVETTLKRTNPWVEGALNFGGHAEFTGSPITFYSSGALGIPPSPLIKKENGFPYDIYVDKNEDGDFDRGSEWGFYAIWDSGPDSLSRYYWNLDRLTREQRIADFGQPGDYDEWPEVGDTPADFTEEGDLIANGNVIFYRTPRIHGDILAHGDITLQVDTLSYVTGEMLSEQPSRPLLFVDFTDTTYWKDSLNFTLVHPGDLGSPPYEDWEWISTSKIARYEGTETDSFYGKYFFVEPIQTVLIDSAMSGIMQLATPGNIKIRNDIIVREELTSVLDFSLLLSQYNITIAGDKILIRSGLYSQFGNLVVEGKNPVIHGFVMVGGSGTIDKDLVIVLMDIFHSLDFSESALFKKRNEYNMTTLSWREVTFD
jgi:hypothetical protein